MRIFKVFLVVIIFLLVVIPAMAVDFTANSDGNFTAATTWNTTPAQGEGVTYPGPNNTVDFAGKHITMDQLTTPSTYDAGGRLGNITASGAAGWAEFPMGAGSFKFGAANITPGTVGATGFLVVSGTPGANTFALTCTTLAAGATSNNIALLINSAITSGCTFTGALAGGAASSSAIKIATGNAVAMSINLVGTAQGGSTADSTAIVCSSTTASLTITGNSTATGDIIGGSGARAHAIIIANGTGLAFVNCYIKGGAATNAFGVSSTSTVPTFTNCNLINATGIAYSGPSPVWSPGAATIISYAAIGAGTATTFAPVVAATNLKDTVVNGTVTGTRTDCPVAKALDSQSYGAGGTGLTGTYHEATTAEVKKGVTFGPSNTYTGTLAGSGVFGVSP